MDKTERMGNRPIPELLLHFAAPAITGLIVNALYNIVDRIFIGHAVGPAGIAAITVSFPFMMAVIAYGILVGVGSSSLISIFLGEKNIEKAESVLGNGVLLILAGGLLCALAGAFSLDAVLKLSGASEYILPYGRTYLGIILFGIPFSSISFGFNYFIRAEGRPDHAMFTLIIGAVLNIILDWLFIIVFSMGIAGAAFATVLAQVAASCWVFSFYFGHKGNLQIRLMALFPRKEIMKKILIIGASPFLMEMTFTVILILFNRVIYAYGGDIAISAVGIFFSLDSLLFLPVLGIGEGLQPLVGYNYGARVYSRVIHAIKLAMMSAVGFFLISFTIIMLFPYPLVHLFNTTSKELIDLTIRGMRLGYMGLPVAGVTIITSFTLQALGKARESLILNIFRQVIFFIPCLIILPKYVGLDGVWLSLPVSDVLGGILAGIIIKQEIGSMRKKERALFSRVT